MGATYPFMSLPASVARLKLKTTSSAVNGVPSWNLTPRRRSKRHTVGEVWVHWVASSGTIDMSLPRPTSDS